eukprot:12073976-Karenia_brevis.AAC.1
MSVPFKHTAWRHSGLFKKSAQVGPVKHQKTADMLLIDDTSECALPPSSDATVHISPSEKHQQIGVEAALEVIRHA